VGLQNAAASGADWAAIFMIEYYTEVWSGNYGSGAGSGSEGGPVSNWTAGEFKTWDVIVNGGVGTRFYEDGVELTGSPLTTNVPNDYLSALVYSSDANTVYVDWILTRKYAAPEPAVALGPNSILSCSSPCPCGRGAPVDIFSARAGHAREGARVLVDDCMSGLQAQASRELE